MGVKLQDTLEKRGTGQFPLLNDNDLLGGLQIVTTKSSTVPPVVNRKQGMLVYETSTGETWQLTTLPDTWVEVEIGATGAKSSVLLFQPGGDPSGNIYTDWGLLYAAFQATKGVVTIGLIPYDTSFTCVMDTGDPYDFENRAHFVGYLTDLSDRMKLVIKSDSIVQNPLSFSDMYVSVETVTNPTIEFNYNNAICSFYNAILRQTEGATVFINTATSFYLYGCSDIDGTAIKLAYGAALYVCANDISRWRAGCESLGDAWLSLYLASPSATIFHDAPVEGLVVNLYLADSFYTVYYDSAEAFPCNNKFGDKSLLSATIGGNPAINTLVLASDMTIAEDGGENIVRPGLTIKATTLGTTAKKTLTVTESAKVEGISRFENLTLVFNSSTYSVANTPVTFVNCTMSVNTGKKGFSITLLDRGIYFDNCVVGNDAGEAVFRTSIDLGTASTQSTVQARRSFIYSDAFEGSASPDKVVIIAKQDPVTIIEPTTKSNIVVSGYRSFVYTGDIYGSDSSTAVRGIYAKPIDSGAADPANRSVLIYNATDVEYQSSPFLQDYMITTANPVVTMTTPPKTNFVEVGETLSVPIFGITYTPTFESAPVPTVCNLKCYDYNDTYPTDPTYTEDILPDPESPQSAHSFTETVYGRTWRYAVEVSRGIGPITRWGYLQLTWVNKVYYGAVTPPDYYDQVFIKALGTNALTNTAYRTCSPVTADGTKRIYYAYRSETELTENNFWIGGFQGGFTDKTNPTYRCTLGTYAAGAGEDAVDFSINGGGTVTVELSTVASGRAAYIAALNAALSTATAYDADPDIVIATDAKGHSVVAEVEEVRGDAGAKLGIAVGSFDKLVKTTNDTVGTAYDIWESNQAGLGVCTLIVQA